MTATLLLKNADLLCTMVPAGQPSGRAGDDVGAEIKGGGLFVRDGVIDSVGPNRKTQKMPQMVKTRKTHIYVYVCVPLPN